MIGKGVIINTSDFAVVAAGQPVTIYEVVFVSGGTAGTLNIRHGSTSSDTVAAKALGKISGSEIVRLGSNGIFFPNGCFIDFDANITNAAVAYEVL